MASQRKIGVLLGYANIVIKNLVNLAYTPMILAFVGKINYGVYQTSNSFVFSLSLLSFGFSEAYVRFYTQRKANGTEADIRQLNGMYLLLYLCICLVTFVLGLTFAANADFFFSDSFTTEQMSLARTLMAIMAVTVTLTLSSTVFDAYILAHEQFKFQQSRQMLVTLAAPGMAFVLLTFGMGTIGVALAQLVMNLLLLILNARFAIVKLGMRFDVHQFDSTLLKAIAAFSAWIFINQVCELVNQSLPNTLLGVLSGPAAVAVFSISVQIRSVFYSLSVTMSSVFTPLINQIVAESDDNTILTGLMVRVGRYQSMLYCWVLGGFILLGRFFIDKWAGVEFSGAYSLIIVMVIPLIIPLTQNTGIEIQRAKNKHRARSVAYLLMAAINVGLTVALAKPMGYMAPAVGYVAYVLLGCGIFMNWYYQKRIRLSMGRFWRRVTPVLFNCFAVTACCMFGSILFPVNSWTTFFAWGVIYSAIYVTTIVKVIMSVDERAMLFGKLHRLRRT